MKSYFSWNLINLFNRIAYTKIQEIFFEKSMTKFQNSNKNRSKDDCSFGDSKILNIDIDNLICYIIFRWKR